MKKIKKLLGLTEEAPKPGHWLEGLRSAGTTNVPATTGDVNTSAVERMLNTPMDRRTMMERTGQAAQAASTMNRLGGALEGLVPRAVETAGDELPLIGADEFVTRIMNGMSPSDVREFVEDFDIHPEQLLKDALEKFPQLKKLKVDPESDQPGILDAIQGQLKNDGDEEYYDGLRSVFEFLGFDR